MFQQKGVVRPVSSKTRKTFGKTGILPKCENTPTFPNRLNTHSCLFPSAQVTVSTVCRKVSSPYWKSPVTPVTYMAFKALMCHDPPASAALSQCLRTQTVCPMACTCKWKTQMGTSQHIYIYAYVYVYVCVYVFCFCFCICICKCTINVYIFSYSRELCEEGIMEEFVRKRTVRRVGGYDTLVQSVRTLLLVGTVHPYDTCVQCVQQARAVCTVCAYGAYLMCVWTI